MTGPDITETPSRTYRPDIDGLRAVAVLAVMLYHSGNTPFSGGYVGVDVFFVISGFLITGLVVHDIQSGRFSLAVFYERRIRRIFPAFFTVAIAAGLAGAWLYDAKTFSDLWVSIAAATASVANLLFYSQAGYFDGPSLLKPLLHTWSLSVEEQFYLVLPLTLFFIYKYARRWLTPILSLLLLGSLGWSIYTVQVERDAAFYMAWLRAWELLAGALVSLRPVRLKPWLQNLLAAAGLLAILAASLLYTDATLFPGLSALAPVLGTVLIINCGMDGGSLVGKFLSLPPLVWIGKLSYSLYLWHWPLLVMARYVMITPLSGRAYLAWWALTFALSFLSWKFVETPFRAKSFLPRPRIFYFSAATGALILAGAGLVLATQGLPVRIDLNTSLPPEVWNTQFGQWNDCQSAQAIGQPGCGLGTSGASPSFLVWGNSHAHAFAPGFDQAAARTGQSGYITWQGGCPPLLGLGKGVAASCNLFNEGVMTAIRAHPEFKTVILAASWLPGELTDESLNQTVGALAAEGRQVYIISPFPEVAYNVSAVYFIAGRTGRDANALIAPLTKDFMNAKNKRVFEILDSLAAKNSSVHVIDIWDIFCGEKRCDVIVNNRPLYVDGGHLSTTGALLLAPRLGQIFR